jgi:hypothetical protein
LTGATVEQTTSLCRSIYVSVLRVQNLHVSTLVKNPFRLVCHLRLSLGGKWSRAGACGRLELQRTNGSSQKWDSDRIFRVFIRFVRARRRLVASPRRRGLIGTMMPTRCHIKNASALLVHLVGYYMVSDALMIVTR